MAAELVTFICERLSDSVTRSRDGQPATIFRNTRFHALH
jgi:hypothetical protein